MNRSLVVIASLVIIFSSCGKDKQKTLSSSEVDARIDSMMGERIPELNKQSMEDLDHRMAIEVKAKADSIVDARTGKIDTTKKANTQPSRKITPQTIFGKKKS